MAKLPKLSGAEVLKVLYKLGFVPVRQRGSHVIVAKEIFGSRIGTAVPMHKELKVGTLKGVLKQINVSEESFIEALER